MIHQKAGFSTSPFAGMTLGETRAFPTWPLIVLEALTLNLTAKPLVGDQIALLSDPKGVFFLRVE